MGQGLKGDALGEAYTPHILPEDLSQTHHASATERRNPTSHYSDYQAINAMVGRV